MDAFLNIHRFSEGNLYYMEVRSMGVGIKTEIKSQIYSTVAA